MVESKPSFCTDSKYFLAFLFFNRFEWLNRCIILFIQPKMPHCFLTYTVSLPSIFYADVNECSDKPGLCGKTGECFNTPGSYKCICGIGHEWNSEGCIGIIISHHHHHHHYHHCHHHHASLSPPSRIIVTTVTHHCHHHHASLSPPSRIIATTITRHCHHHHALLPPPSRIIVIIIITTIITHHP